MQRMMAASKHAKEAEMNIRPIRPAGIAPPLNHLDLPAGAHTITVRNGDAPPQTRLVEVHPDQPVSLKFRF